jgi:hypothetical protein
MVPSVRLLYSNGVIQFQQDHSRIHSSSAVKNDYGCQMMLNSFPGHHDQPYLNSGLINAAEITFEIHICT